jgi:hypothetical protein
MGERKKNKSLFVLPLLLFVPLSPRAETIPEGIIQGRTDVPYGTYGTVVQESARFYQDKIEALANRAYGLSQLVKEAPIAQAKAAYALEAEVLRLFLDISNAPRGNISDAERRMLLFHASRVYGDVRHHGERIFENMVRYIDQKLPGPNGQQIRSDPQKGVDGSLYAPNYRSDRTLTPEERAKLYQEKLNEFRAKGGDLNEVKVLKDSTVRTLGAFSRFEYVWMPSGEIRITDGSAGHILLAGGESVKAAGQLILLKNNRGALVHLIVSNASGSYKPDLISAQNLADHILQRVLDPAERSPFLGPPEITKGEPMSTQAVKIYLKADGVAKDVAAKTLLEMEEATRKILPKATILPRLGAIGECGAVFQ